MDSRNLPTIEAIQRGRQLVWRVCGMGLCAEEFNSGRAWAKFEDLCRRRGIELPRGGPGQPCRGPSEVDEPGV